jgi:hypothetical protein
MALQLNPNDNARESKPGLWVFQGKWTVLPVVGVAVGIMIFRALGSYVDWYYAVGISGLPFLLMVAYVLAFVNGKPPSHALDLLVLALWRFRCRWYLAGLLDRPPQLWTVPRRPAHPAEFS